MTRVALWWILGVMGVCVLSQIEAADLRPETTRRDGATQAVFRLSDGSPTGDVAQCGVSCDARGSDGGFSDPCGCGGYGCGCGDCGGLLGFGLLGPSDGSDPWSVWVWGGPTYSSGVVNQAFGFAEGVNVGCRLTDAVGLIGGIGFNHQVSSTLAPGFSAASMQILGTLGVQKFGNPDGGDLLERTSVWVLWDQAAFLLVDPPDPYGLASSQTLYGVYQHQIRLMAGYVTGYHNEVGAAWSFPIGDDSFGGGYLSPLGGPGYLTSAGGFLGGYVKQRAGDTDLTTSIGYSQGAGGLALGVGAERALTERVNIYADFKAGDGSNYAGSVGMAIGLGRADTKYY